MMTQSFQDRLFPNLPKITRHFHGPFHIYDEVGIRLTCARVKRAFAGCSGGFQEFFAVKALPNPAIASIMESEGFGFDCSSPVELTIARRAGATGERIMFTSNNTTANEFLQATEQGGCIMNFDDIGLFKKFPDKFPELCCFRLNPGGRKTGDEVNPIIGEPTKSKYGVPLEQIVSAYRLAQQTGAKRFGLHTMVCSNDLNYKHMVNTIKLLLEVAELLMVKLGIRVEFINMGGGIGIPYRPTDEPFDLEALGYEAQELLHTFGRAFGFTPKLCMESGRFMTGPHGVLVNQVINIKRTYQTFIGVQAAMTGLMRPAIYGAYHHMYVVRPDGTLKQGGPMEKVHVVGPICENCDRLTPLDEPRELPVIEEGDYIVTANTGAHALAMTFRYNGRLPCQEVLLRANRSAKCIGRAVTSHDYMDMYVHDATEIPLTA